MFPFPQRANYRPSTMTTKRSEATDECAIKHSFKLALAAFWHFVCFSFVRSWFGAYTASVDASPFKRKSNLRCPNRHRFDARSISVRSLAFGIQSFCANFCRSQCQRNRSWLHRESPINLKCTVRTRKYETSRYTHPFSVHFEANGSNLHWCIFMRPEHGSRWLSVFRHTKTRRFFYLFSVSSLSPFHWRSAILWHGPLWAPRARLTVYIEIVCSKSIIVC